MKGQIFPKTPRTKSPQVQKKVVYCDKPIWKYRRKKFSNPKGYEQILVISDCVEDFFQLYNPVM